VTDREKPLGTATSEGERNRLDLLATALDMDPSAAARAIRGRIRTLVRRLRRIERGELRECGAWLETTRNLLHVSVLVVVPLVVAAVVAVSNALEAVSFLLYPPLAAGAYTLFADPAGRYASPIRFVVGLTLGAACGWPRCGSPPPSAPGERHQSARSGARGPHHRGNRVGRGRRGAGETVYVVARRSQIRQLEAMAGGAGGPTVPEGDETRGRTGD